MFCLKYIKLGQRNFNVFAELVLHFLRDFRFTFCYFTFSISFSFLTMKGGLDKNVSFLNFLMFKVILV